MPGRAELGDIDVEDFRHAAHAAADWVADYLRDIRSMRVAPAVGPEEVAAKLTTAAPERAEALESVLADFERVIAPGMTHWNHPRFMAYFGITGSAPGIIAELLIAALNVNAMQWHTSPAATELEEVTTDWLRQAFGLPETFRGVINDTASTSTLYALAAAREAVPGLDARRQGLSRARLRMYTSDEAHSSVEKAAIVLGIGQDGVVKIGTDSELRMDSRQLDDAIRRDRELGFQPFAVVATVGTTSTTSIDPVPEIAGICRAQALWLHVDAAYGGAAAVLPSHRHVLAGCEHADSIVINPHKWLFTPIDCSLLYCQREDVLKQTFSLVPDYLRERATGTRNLSDFGLALGRRFRSLKLWFVLRAFGLEGIRERIAAHIAMAQQLRVWVEADARFELLAPTPFSTVVFRLRGSDAENEHIVESVNGSGEAYISHTTVRGRYAIRVAIGNLRTTLGDVRAVWELIQKPAPEVV